MFSFGSNRKFDHILKYLKFYVTAVTHGRLMFSFSTIYKLDGSLPANPVNDRCVANAVTLKSTFRLPQKSAIIQKYLIMKPPEK